MEQRRFGDSDLTCSALGFEGVPTHADTPQIVEPFLPAVEAVEQVSPK